MIQAEIPIKRAKDSIKMFIVILSKRNFYTEVKNWRMRRDLNPRYELPRIHDFESRAFSLSATHPVIFNLVLLLLIIFILMNAHD